MVWDLRMGSAPLRGCRTVQHAGGDLVFAGSPMTHHSWHTAVGGGLQTGLGMNVGSAWSHCPAGEPPSPVEAGTEGGPWATGLAWKRTWRHYRAERTGCEVGRTTGWTGEGAGGNWRRLEGLGIEEGLGALESPGRWYSGKTTSDQIPSWTGRVFWCAAGDHGGIANRWMSG